MTIQFFNAMLHVASIVLSIACFIVGIVTVRIMETWARRMAKVMFVIAVISNWEAYVTSLAAVLTIIMLLVACYMYRWYWGGGRELRWSRHPQITTDSDKEA